MLLMNENTIVPLLCRVFYISGLVATGKVFKLGRKGLGYYYDAFERSPPFSWSEEHDTITILVSKLCEDSVTTRVSIHVMS